MILHVVVYKIFIFYLKPFRIQSTNIITNSTMPNHVLTPFSGVSLLYVGYLWWFIKIISGSFMCIKLYYSQVSSKFQ